MLGKYAGYGLTKEKLQFILTTQLDMRKDVMVEFRTTMTDEEYKVMHKVIGRAVRNQHTIDISKYPKE